MRDDSVQPPHKGWYSRNYLPHFDEPGLVQSITFRLHDSMPLERRTEWEELLHTTDLALRDERIEAYINRGYGSCLLADVRTAEVVQDSLLYFDGLRYRLLGWVIMPNHIHVLAKMVPGHTLPAVVQAWKSFTAKEANRALGRTGPFWHRDFYDRFVRDERHLGNALRYIHENPVKAGLVEKAEQWQFSSARVWSEGD
jgi:putative transposase